MTRISVATLSLALGIFSALPAMADAPSPDGDWSRSDGKAKVHIAPCGNDLCAVNTWIRSDDKDEKVGDKLIMTIKSGINGVWTGKASDPQRHLNYRLTLKLNGNAMTTSGCVLGGLLCKHVSWKRLDA